MLLAATPPAPVPATFYNQPGATDALLAAELARCRAIATGPMAGETMAGPLTAPLPVPRGREPILSSEAECMVARGWSLYALSARDRAALTRMSAARRGRTVRGLTGAERPVVGRLLRQGQTLALRRRIAPSR